MELLVKREIKTGLSTTGWFFINCVGSCDCLETKDRGLTLAMTLQAINDVKIAGKTAIPTGLYEVEKYFSPDHNAWVPTLMKVLGFGYVEIHKGNFQKDTKGCLLLGTDKGVDEVLNSADAIHNFYPQVFAALKRGEGVWITFL